MGTLAQAVGGEGVRDPPLPGLLARFDLTGPLGRGSLTIGVSARDPSPDARSDGELIGQFTSLLQRVHIPCWIFDDNGVFEWVNDAFVATFGDLRGAPYSALIAPESLETATRHFSAMYETDPGAEVELDMMRSDGSRVRSEVSSVLLEGIGLCCGAFGLAGSPARPRATVSTDLTPRQLEVLLLLAGGASTAQIAKELYLSETTVRNHISNILQVLRVHSRLAAVAKARREGLIGD
jgi:DNA-binding CsgD family transcriptional regulator